jgi:hypothetical protein
MIRWGNGDQVTQPGDRVIDEPVSGRVAARFLRYQSVVPNRRGVFPGVFALANGLAKAGRLELADHTWWRATNAHWEAVWTDPSTVNPTCYDRELHPGAVSWFKSDATALIAMCREYLDLLDRYDVPWVELRTNHPGWIVYEDATQVVATPYTYESDWPLTDGRSRS